MHSVFVKDWDVEAAMEKAEYRWCDIQVPLRVFHTQRGQRPPTSPCRSDIRFCVAPFHDSQPIEQ